MIENPLVELCLFIFLISDVFFTSRRFKGENEKGQEFNGKVANISNSRETNPEQKVQAQPKCN